ncbi:hypothetical protein [Flavobacterium solisilvae]|uniref:Uncharacterized protein n=1 Tax=Flavobacterium solisilvae TaxID=1852019 RepID=A0ABX1QYA1_9FLAO|nr:hypothetical protein [Flavobacterium solisilvae]NMH26010.1 hypothetical protein [Flavobacterium solisilvae]
MQYVYSFSPDRSENPFYYFENKHLDCARCDKIIKRLKRIAGKWTTRIPKPFAPNLN